jgi:hypothetical protein
MWQAWAQNAGGAAAFYPGRQAKDPLIEALAGYRRFVDGVMDALRADPTAASGAGFAAFIEKLSSQSWNDLHGDGPSPWFGIPCSLLGSGFDSPLFEQAQDGQALLDAWTTEFLEIPPLGPQREWQLTGQTLHSALLEQRSTFAKVAEHYRKSASIGLKRFAEYLRQTDGAPIESLRALYDAWIDVAEQSYRETVMTEAFSHDFGAFINASSRVRAASNVIQQRLTDSIGVPGLREFEVLEDQQARLRAEVDALRREIEHEHQTQVAGKVRPVSERQESPALQNKARVRVAKNNSVRGSRPRKQASRARKKMVDEFNIDHILPPAD